MAAAPSDVPMADRPDEARPSPPSGWTAVNGRPSPTTAEQPPTSMSPSTEKPASVAPMISTGDVPPTGISHHLVEDPALTTSPSTEESATTAGRHESPPSPASVVHVASANNRKRSFDGAFAIETIPASTGAAPPQQSAEVRTLPPLQPQPPPDSQQASTREEGRAPEAEPATTSTQPRHSPDNEADLLTSEAAPASALDGSNEQDDFDLRDSSPNRADSDDGDGDQSFASPDRDESRAGDGSRTASGVQVDPERTKRRKRVFSNRTKTGCMTCRKRKKKCDETHPECKWYLFLFIVGAGAGAAWGSCGRFDRLTRGATTGGAYATPLTRLSACQSLSLPRPAPCRLGQCDPRRGLAGSHPRGSRVSRLAR
jgi:hypothetical protein